MYERIPNSAMPEKVKMSAREEAAHYAINRKVYEEIRYAYRCGYIDRQQMLTLRGQVRAGNGEGAMKGLGTLLLKGHW